MAPSGGARCDQQKAAAAGAVPPAARDAARKGATAAAHGEREVRARPRGAGVRLLFPAGTPGAQLPAPSQMHAPPSRQAAAAAAELSADFEARLASEAAAADALAARLRDAAERAARLRAHAERDGRGLAAAVQQARAAAAAAAAEEEAHAREDELRAAAEREEWERQLADAQAETVGFGGAQPGGFPGALVVGALRGHGVHPILTPPLAGGRGARARGGARRVF
jgi:hypothetical protein